MTHEPDRSNAWGAEPPRGIRMHRNHVRVAITPPNPDAGLGSEPYHVSCGLFRTNGGCDEHQDLREWKSHDVPTLEVALQVAHAALERCAYVWSCPTSEVMERAAQQHSTSCCPTGGADADGA